MPWTETCVMEERVKFIMDVSDSTYSMAELCNYYGISRKTGYKWLDRYRQGGIEALHNRSRAPHNHPHEIPHQAKLSIFSLEIFLVNICNSFTRLVANLVYRK